MGPLANRLVWLAPLLLAVLAFALRATGQGEVFANGDVVPIGGEAWYHFRRQVIGAASFPATLDFDPFLRFVSGAVPPWAPGFDALIGWLAAGAEDGDTAARRIAAWSPTIAGALGAVVVFALLAPRFGAWIGGLAGAVLALVPAHVIASQVGYVNHRVAGVTLGLVALASIAGLLRDAPRSPARGFALAVAAGLASAFALWVSMASLLPVAAAHLLLFGHAATRASRAAALDALQRVAVVELVTLLFVAWFAWPLPDASAAALSVRYPSRLHVLYFAGSLLLALACLVAWRVRFGEGIAARVATLIGAAVVVDALGFAFVAGLGDALRALPDALIGDPSAHAARLEPAVGTLGSLSEIAEVLTAFGCALPVLLVLALALEWRREDRAELVLLCGIAALLAFAAWSEPGGFAAAGAAVALATGCAAGAVWRRAGAGWLRAVTLLAALVVVAPALPGSLSAPPRAREIAVGDASLAPAVVSHVFGWLAEHGRDGGDWLDPGKPPLYSVVAPWQVGHRLLFEAHRAPLIDGFFPTIAPGRLGIVDRLYREPAYRSVSELQRFKTRYVIVPDVEGFPGGELRRDGLVSALIDFDGGEAAEPQSGEPFAVSFLRLVYEHGQRQDGGALRVYEHVRGARVVGAARPERLIRFSLRLRTSTGREFTYRVTTYSDPYLGNFEVRLPYSTLPTKRERFVEPLGSWRIECEGESVSVDVPDWKVRDGAQVDAPGLCY